MEKLTPPNIFVLKKEEQTNLVIKTSEFYKILIKVLIQKPAVFALNIPETIIKGNGLEEAYLLHIDDGVLVYSTNLSQHTLTKFYKRCSYYRHQNSPICICKTLNSANDDSSIIANTISECEVLWKKHSSVLIQRFLSTGPEVIFKARILYHACKDQYLGKLLWKDKDKTYKLAKYDEYREEDISVNEHLKDQMKSLKEILQADSCQSEVIEIVADFIQNERGQWFFIEFVSARLEKMRKKLKNKKKVEVEIEEISLSHTETHRAELKEEALKELKMMLDDPKKPIKKKPKKKKPIIIY